VREKFKVSAFEWLDQLEQGAIPDAESATGYQTRVGSALEQIVRAHPGQSVAVVCHGGVIRVLLSIMLDLPLRKMAAFEIDYASYTHVRYSPSKTEIQLLNFTPWRDAQ
jgi:broad specificity phosphatase PhoE